MSETPPDPDPIASRESSADSESVAPAGPGPRRPSKTYPTRWQLKVLWMAITGVSLLTLCALTVFVGIQIGKVLGYLQSFILPVAVAAVLTYLLAPLVDKLRERGLEHKKAALIVFLGFLFGSGVLIACIAVPVADQVTQLGRSSPRIYRNFENLLEKNLSPDGLAKLVAEWEKHPIGGPLIKMTPFSTEAQKAAKEKEEQAKAAADPDASPFAPPPVPEKAPAGQEPEINAKETTPEAVTRAVTEGSTAATTGFPWITLPGLSAPVEAIAEPEAPALEPPPLDLKLIRDWLAVNIPIAARRVGEGVYRSVGGVLGGLGFILNFLLVPIYLYFFLRETHSIQANWSRYLPIRASRFKDEIVDLVQEINGYLIAFFRGQMLVSLIDGFFTAVILSVVGLKFGLLIGVFVGILGIVPYIGLMVCLVPAVIIAIVQSAQGDWHFLWMQHPAWWVLPVIVIATFIIVNNLDGMLIAPKIVGDSVGLHPLMIIASVIFWSLVLGGLLGALLAVPLTATGQVLFRRYIWERQRKEDEGLPELAPPTSANASKSTAIIPAPPTDIVPVEPAKPASAPTKTASQAGAKSTGPRRRRK